METILINGAKPLTGNVSIIGAKNSVLPIIAATLLTNSECTILNAPMLDDVSACAKIFAQLEGKLCDTNNVIKTNSCEFLESYIPRKLMASMRSSIFFLAPLIAKTGMAALYLPGGCKLGARPINLHLDGLAKMGTDIKFIGDKILCVAQNGLVGAEHNLPFQSVGATETLLMAAVTASGKTYINNAAIEPEVCDLAQFLVKCGASIEGIGTKNLTIIGKSLLNGCEYSIIPDRIAAATILCAVAGTGGEVTINNANSEHLKSVIAALCKVGADIKVLHNKDIKITSDGKLLGDCSIKTGVYPDFPTDAAPMFAACLLKAKGEFSIHDTVFTDRFRCAREFQKLSADVSIKGSTLEITGKNELYGSELVAKDLRGGAAIVIAALMAKGKSSITGVDYIRRGYENIVKSFNELGADIILQEN